MASLHLQIRVRSFGGCKRSGQVAQLVEQRTENPRVGGSTPSLATNLFNDLRRIVIRRFCFSDRLVTKMLFRIEII